MCGGEQVLVDRGKTNGLVFEGAAVRNYRAFRKVYRCAKCGEYSVEFGRDSDDKYDSFIFPDDEKVSMRKR